MKVRVSDINEAVALQTLAQMVVEQVYARPGTYCPDGGWDISETDVRMHVSRLLEGAELLSAVKEMLPDMRALFAKVDKLEGQVKARKVPVEDVKAGVSGLRAVAAAMEAEEDQQEKWSREQTRRWIDCLEAFLYAKQPTEQPHIPNRKAEAPEAEPEPLPATEAYKGEEVERWSR